MRNGFSIGSRLESNPATQARRTTVEVTAVHKYRRHAIVAVLAAAGLMAVGMTSATAKPAKPAKPAVAKLKIGYINLSNQLPFVVLVRKSIERAAKANGVQLVQCDSNLDAQKAINCAAQLKTQGVKGIINFQLDATAAPRVCAAGPKVPVVAIDIHQKPCETVFYGADNFQAGHLSGAELGKYAKTKWACKADALLSVNVPTAGKVVVDRENGWIAGVKAGCPSIQVIKVTTKGTTDSTIQPFTDALTRLPGKHRLLVGATNDDQSIGAIKAAQAAGRLNDLYVAGQGADPTSWPYICGKTPFKHWVADTAYFPERYGDTVVPLLLSLIDGQKKPKFVFVNHRVVTPANIRTIYPSACR
jgi:ribose transport system substrate-binding protein